MLSIIEELQNIIWLIDAGPAHPKLTEAIDHIKALKEQITTYENSDSCSDCVVFNDAVELKTAKKRIEIYLEALKCIEFQSIAIWDSKGKPRSPGAIAQSAREKARQV